MRNLIALLLGLFSFILLTAQTPEGFSYQAVLRNSEGQVLANQAATLRVSLTNNDGTTTHYSETHSVTSTSHGLVNIIVGNGQDKTGDFLATPWSSQPIYLGIEVMLSGATSYTQIGRQQLQAVPYALYAADGAGIEWIGALAVAPASPLKNQAYYNTTSKTSFIWDGNSWEIIAVDGLKGDTGLQGEQGPTGLNGISIEWLGSFPNTSIPDPTQINQAYHNTTDSTSYIWDGSTWQMLTQKGTTGPKGETGDTGAQGDLGPAGLNGISIEWLGSFPNTSIPDPTQINQAYHNTTDSTSYIWDGSMWQVLAQKGTTGSKGETGNAGAQGLQGFAGSDGISIEWLGSFPNASIPVATQINQAYHNTSDSTSYIWNGAAWQILASKGAKGSQGIQGIQGLAGVGLTLRGGWSADSTYTKGDYTFSESSITVGVNSMWICQEPVALSSTMPKDDGIHWVEFEAPEGPQGPEGPVGAKGDKGDTGVQGPIGLSGVSLVWRGEFATAPIDQSINHAYYNTTLYKSYVWDGDSWELLAQDGTVGPKGDTGNTGAQGPIGPMGISVQWKGSLATEPDTPEINWAYYNTTLSKSYVWDGNSWEILAQDGEPGTMGSLVSGTEGQMLVHDGTNWTASSAITVMSDTVGIGTNAPISRLIVQGESSALPEDPIFEVKNKDGNVVFGVYNEGVRVYVADSGTKGVKGGFAVGGLTNQTKSEVEYFRITPDSARIYVNETPIGTKGVKGGFAVGGLTNQTKVTSSRDLLFIAPDSARIYIRDTVSTKGVKGGFAVGGLTNQTKGMTNSYLYIHRDSSRIYIDDTNTKGVKGGFAVGGLTNQTKGDEAKFMNIETQTNYLINPSEPRILWYPLKNAFLVGQVFIQHADSVGTNSTSTGFESMAKGGWSQAFGYRSKARGLYSTAIGYQAIAHSNNSFAFGYNAVAQNTNSFAFGESAQAKGASSYAFGYSAISFGTNSFAFGKSAQANGGSSFAFGDGSTTASAASNSFAFGKSSQANGSSSYALGDGALTGTSATNGFAFGKSSQANGASSYAFGDGSISTGSNSFAFGRIAKSIGNYSFALGDNVTANNQYSYAFGKSSSTSGDYAVAMGNSATASGIGSFAVNGNASGSYSKAFGGTASGSYSLSSGQAATASGANSVAMGYQATASGDYSFALGWYVKATASKSLCFGMGQMAMPPTPASYSEANGVGSIAMGSSVKAMLNGSVAIGASNLSTGLSAFALGFHTTSQAAFSTVVGTYNVISGNTMNWVTTDPLFVIGNGDPNTAVASNAVTVLKNGNVGIATTAPTHKMDIRGPVRIVNDASTYDVWIQGGSATSGDNRNLAFLGKDEDSGDQLFINYDGEYTYGTVIPGYVGIGSTGNNSSYKLLVYGNAGGTSWTNTSDIRWKKNIKPLGSVLQSILALNGVKYEWRIDEFPQMNFDNRINIGLIAQDLEKLFPELVFTDKEGFKSVAYDKLTAVIIEGMKEQQQQIQKLEEQNEFLKAEIEAIKAMLKK